MSAETTRKWCPPPSWISFDDGETWMGQEIEIITTTDIRKTTFGSVDFGHVEFGARRWVTRQQEKRVEIDSKINKWWRKLLALRQR